MLKEDSAEEVVVGGNKSQSVGTKYLGVWLIPGYQSEICVYVLFVK